MMCAVEITALRFGVMIIELTRKHALHALLFTFLLAAQAAAPPQKNADATDSPDAEVKEFRMSALETKL